MDGAARTPALVRLIQDNLRLMRQRQRLQEDEPYVTLQVGRQVFESAPRSMRVELWKSSLQRRGSGVAAARSYADLCAHGAVAGEAGDDIDKDLGRTFPGTRRFAGAEGQAALRRVLRAYAALDPEVGYCQGMNFVAALLLSYLPEPQAFGALVVLMEDRGLRRYYSPDMGLLQAHLWQLGRLMPPRLRAHLESVGVAPSLYAASWLMTTFSAEYPASFSARIMDVVLSEKVDQALLKVAVALLTAGERALLAAGDLEEALTFIKQGMPGWDEATLHDVLSEAFKKPWLPRQLALLATWEGAETVGEAAERIGRANEAAAAAAAGEEGGGGGGGGGSGAGSPKQRLSDGGAPSPLPLLPPPCSPAAGLRSVGSASMRAARSLSGAGAASAGDGAASSSSSALPSPLAPAPATPPAPAAAAAGTAGAAAAAAGDWLGGWEPFGEAPPSPSPQPPPAAAAPEWLWHEERHQHHHQHQHQHHLPAHSHGPSGLGPSASAPAIAGAAAAPAAPRAAAAAAARPASVEPAAAGDCWGDFLSSPHVGLSDSAPHPAAAAGPGSEWQPEWEQAAPTAAAAAAPASVPPQQQQQQQHQHQHQRQQHAQKTQQQAAADSLFEGLFVAAMADSSPGVKSADLLL